MKMGKKNGNQWKNESLLICCRSPAICVCAFSMLTQQQRLSVEFPATKNSDLLPFYDIVKNVVEYEMKLTIQRIIDKI